MRINRFEDIEIWQEAGKLTIRIYEITKNNKLSKDFGFKDQICRAAISIMNNIAEGFERQSSQEFIRFLYYAKGSAGEIRSMAYVALRLEYVSKEEFKEICNKCLTISKQTSKFISYLKKHKKIWL